MEEKAKQIAQLLKLLANEQRLLILCALAQGPMNVGDIHAFTPNITAPALSQHLARLKTAGILDCEKQGMNVIYRLADETVAGLMAFLKEHYCK